MEPFGTRRQRKVTGAPLHIGLILQGGAVWAGGVEYIRNLQLAIGAAGEGTTKVTLLTGRPLDAATRERFADADEIITTRRHGGRLAAGLRLTKRELARTVDQHGIDFLFPFTYDNEWTLGVSLPIGPRVGRARWAGWIPDFQHRRLPQLFDESDRAQRDRGIALLGSDAETIVFSSHATARDFADLCPGATARATVVQFCTASVPEWFEGDPAATQARYHLPDRFFMVSNQFWQHKNHRTLIAALALLAARGIRPHVVCTGQTLDYRDTSYFNGLLATLHQSGVASQVSILGMIPRTEQLQLMRRAIAVVQPSLCEGWSTVVEDARLLGKVVLASDIAVHREQNPAGACFFPAESPTALAELIAAAWLELGPGPDAAAESAARAGAEARLAEFGRNFLAIARP